MENDWLGVVAGGISEAVITTAIGLLVAIPAVSMFRYFSNRINAFDIEMDRGDRRKLKKSIGDI